MTASKYVLIATVAFLALLSSFSPSANALGEHGSKPANVHFKPNKHAGLFGGNYLAPKKQRRPTGYYRSTLTGKVVYGKPKK